MARTTDLTPAARALLRFLASDKAATTESGAKRATNPQAIVELLAADLITRVAGQLRVSAAGRAHLAREAARREEADVDPFLAQHIDTVMRTAAGPEGPVAVRMNDAESPLIWLARRKGRDGAALISPTQLQAGERLRSDFTSAQLTPRLTANWNAVGRARRSGSGAGLNLTDIVVAARQRLRHALAAAGPEFAGLLLDVCCFLKRLDDVERERQWPVRSAKIVLQLGLDRLARHYGLEAAATGPRAAAIRTWLAPDAAFVVDGP